MARPSLFTPELADTILDRISTGESLVSIGKDDAMPEQRTIYRWLAKDAEFCQRYLRARENQAETLAQEVLEIQDETPPMAVVESNNGSSIRVDSGWVQWQKNRVDARMRLMGKLAPKRYGDSQNVNVTGSLDVRSVFAGINAAHEARTQPRADSDTPVA